MPAPPAIKALGGRSLTGGSQKQRDWAERIRLSMVSRMSLEEAVRVCDPNGILTDARWWIEQRNLPPSAIADFVTDPPFEMPGKRLAEIVARYRVQHLVLITTMRQLLEFMPHTPFELAFDFVIDGVAPKQSKSLQQPNYTHQTGVYLKRTGVKSAFNRKLRQRSDQFSAALR